MVSLVYLHLILGHSTWYMFSTFLVFLSILQSSELFKSTLPVLYLITGAAHVFKAFTVFPELSFISSIAFNPFIHSFLIISFLSWCFISSPSIIPKYSYPVSCTSDVISMWQVYFFSPCDFASLDVDKCTFLYSRLHPDVT